MTLFERVLSKVLRTIRLDFLLLFLSSKSYLKTTGWFKSSFQKKCIDKDRNPTPWWTYGATRFLSERIRANSRVFEYGSGYSTLWLAKRVASLTSIDDNKSWIDLLKKQIPENVTLVYSKTEDVKYGDKTFLPLGSSQYPYSKEIHTSGSKYDIIVVDGVDRNNCIAEAIFKAEVDGVIIVDNLELSHLMHDALSLLYENEYRLLEFWGISPGISHETGTGIFYRDQNCLGI